MSQPSSSAPSSRLPSAPVSVPAPVVDDWEEEERNQIKTEKRSALTPALLCAGGVSLALAVIYRNGRANAHRSLSHRTMEARVMAQATVVTGLAGLAVYSVFFSGDQQRPKPYSTQSVTDKH